MKKKKTGIIVFIIIAMIILAGLSVYLTYRNTHSNLYRIEAVDAEDGCLYGISRAEDGMYSFFAIDIKTGRTDSIGYPVSPGKVKGIRVIRKKCYIPVIYEIGTEKETGIIRYDPEKGTQEIFYHDDSGEELSLISEGYCNDTNCIVLYFNDPDYSRSGGKQRMVYLDDAGNEIFTRKGYILDRDCFNLEAVGDNKLAWIGIGGDVITSDINGVRTICYDAKKDGQIHYNTAYSIYPDRAEFYDIKNKETVTVPLDGSGAISIEPAPEFGNTQDDIVYITGKTGGYRFMLAGDGYGNDHLYAMDDAGSSCRYEEVSASPGHFALVSVRYFLAFAAAFVVLFAIIYLIYKKNNKIIPCVIIVCLILIVLSIFGSRVLSEQVQNSQTIQQGESNIERLGLISDAISAAIDRDEYDKADFVDGYAYIYDLSHNTDSIFNGPSAMDSGNKFITKRTYNIPVMSLFYKYHDGEFFSADGGDVATRPVSIGTTDIPSSVLMKAAETGKRVCYDGSSATNGAFSSYINPVSASDGTITGAFAVIIYDDQLAAVNQLSRLQLIIVDILLLILVLVICIVFAVSSKPIVKMAGNLERLTASGDMDEHVKVRGCDEVQELTRVYNRLIDNVRHYFRETGNISKMNSAFLPNELVSLMGEESIADINAGDRRKLFTIVYSAYHYIYRHAEDTEIQNNLFDRMRKSTGSILEAVHKYGGITLKVDEQIVTALFREEYSQAIEMAVDVCIRNKKLDGEQDCRGTGFVSALSASDVVISAEGIKTHMEFVPDEDTVSLNKAIARQGMIINTPVIADDSVIRGLGAFVIRHHIRYTGQIEYNGRKIRLYEVFDWETAEDIELKEQTRDEFESGVRAMESGNYELAQMHFGNILKIHSNDSTAGVFFKQCDILSHEERG